MQKSEQAQAALREINGKLEWIVRMLDDQESRYATAADEGFKLSGVVRDFLQDPEGVGTDKLNEAYHRFMQMHAGNFYPAPVAAGL